MKELQKAAEVGPKVSRSIHQFFQEKHNHALIEKLRAAGFSFTHAVKKREGGPLAGKTLVLTGRVPNLAGDEAMLWFEAAGGMVAG